MKDLKGEVLDSEYIGDSGYSFLSVTGKKLHISKYDIGFLEKLRRLPVDDKIFLMCLSVEDIDQYLKRYKKTLNKKVVEIFSKEWLARETGEPFSFDDADLNVRMFGIDLTDTEIMNTAKKGKLSTESCSKIVDYFESDRCEFYTKDSDH